jgi:hypothetical protein
VSGYRATIVAAVVLTLVLIAAPQPPHADSVKTAEVVFLTLELSDAGVTLLEWNTVPGIVKRSRGKFTHSSIAYSAKSASGESLWHGGLDDPRIVRVETYALDSTSSITPHLIRRETAQFTIRVPYGAEIDRIDFVRQSTDYKSNQATLIQTPLSSVAWPSTRAGKRP